MQLPKRVILFHGLPQRGAGDPIDHQFGRLRQDLESRGYEVTPYRWCSDRGLEIGRELHRLRAPNESALDHHADRFNQWFLEDISSEDRSVADIGWQGYQHAVYPDLGSPCKISVKI